jgi:hypothetical protein
VQLAQGPSDRVLVSLTRFEFFTTGEEITGTTGNISGTVQPVPMAQPVGHPQKVFEFTADMSPDQALLVANNILEALAKLSNEKKAKYGIPENIRPYQSTLTGRS